MGRVVHECEGSILEKPAPRFAVPQDFDVVAMFAVGRPGDPDQLPPAYREIEKPSGRKQVREFIGEGRRAETDAPYPLSLT